MNLARPLANRAAELVRVLAKLTNPAGGPGYWLRPGRGRRHPTAESLLRSLGWPRTQFRRAVDESVEQGWIARGVNSKTGDEVFAVEQLAVALFNLADPGRREPPLPEQLDGMPHAELVSALATFRCSAPAVSRVAASLGWTEEATWGECEQAAASGLVEEWPDHPAEPTVGLSSLSAARLGLTLSDDGSRWLAEGEPDRSWSLEPSRFPSEADFPDDGDRGLFDATADPTSPDGLAWAEAGERANLALDRLDTDWEAAEIERRVRDGKEWGVTEAEARKDIRHDARGKMPHVSTVLGLRLTWPVVWTPEHGPCPGCGGEPMGVLACCLVCDAAGLDRVFGRIGHHDWDVGSTDTLATLPVVTPASGAGPTDWTPKKGADRRAG